MRAMKIENGIVVNVAIFDSEDDFFESYEAAEPIVGPGHSRKPDGTFAPPKRRDIDLPSKQITNKG